jgi:hypothetical protein
MEAGTDISMHRALDVGGGVGVRRELEIIKVR